MFATLAAAPASATEPALTTRELVLAAAKKAYSGQRALAGYAYEYAIAGHKLVAGTATKRGSRPFALSISTTFQFQ